MIELNRIRSEDNIYLIKSGDLVKMGYSGNIGERLKSYRYSNPNAELIDTYKIRDAQENEKKFHQTNKSAVLNEWYSISDIDKIFEFIYKHQEYMCTPLSFASDCNLAIRQIPKNGGIETSHTGFGEPTYDFVGYKCMVSIEYDDLIVCDTNDIKRYVFETMSLNIIRGYNKKVVLCDVKLSNDYSIYLIHSTVNGIDNTRFFEKEDYYCCLNTHKENCSKSIPEEYRCEYELFTKKRGKPIDYIKGYNITQK